MAAGARDRGASLAVASRDPARAREFVEWARALGVDAFADDGRAVDTVINSTPLGLKPDEALPVTDERMDSATAALDLVYAPGETRWVRHCRERGLRAADGRVMLVAQGAHAFQRFFPDALAPRDIMTAAVNRGLGE